MKPLPLENRKKKWIKIISIIQIFGGIIGIHATSPLYRDTSGNTYIFLIGILFMMPFVISLIAGVLLWQNLRVGIFLSIIIQGMQIVQCSLRSFLLYIFYSGMKFCVGFSWPTLGFSWEIGSQIDFIIGKHFRPSMLSINILALLFFVYLLKYLKRQKVTTGEFHPSG